MPSASKDNNERVTDTHFDCCPSADSRGHSVPTPHSATCRLWARCSPAVRVPLTLTPSHPGLPPTLAKPPVTHPKFWHLRRRRDCPPLSTPRVLQGSFSHSLRVLSPYALTTFQVLTQRSTQRPHGIFTALTAPHHLSPPSHQPPSPLQRELTVTERRPPPTDCRPVPIVAG